MKKSISLSFCLAIFLLIHPLFLQKARGMNQVIFLDKFLFIGPEFYQSERVRSESGKQDGYMYGSRLRYHAIKKYGGGYWGVDGFWAQGDLRGTANGYKIKFQSRDTQVEGRLGYTFFLPSVWFQPNLTLWGGYGYFEEVNHFVRPSPLPLKFRNSFQYGAVGALLRISLTHALTLGLDVKGKYSYDGKSKISNDPDREGVTLKIGEEVHYEVDVPLTYSPCGYGGSYKVSFEPFFRYRHYGGFSNYFKDKGISIPFHETEFRIWGMRAGASFCF